MTIPKQGGHLLAKRLLCQTQEFYDALNEHGLVVDFRRRFEELLDGMGIVKGKGELSDTRETDFLKEIAAEEFYKIMCQRDEQGLTTLNPSPVSPSKPKLKGRRQLFTSEQRAILMDYYKQHHDDPYPPDADKDMLCAKTGLRLSQVNVWFTNRRGRDKDRQAMKKMKEDAIRDQAPNLCLRNLSSTVIPPSLGAVYSTRLAGDIAPSVEMGVDTKETDRNSSGLSSLTPQDQSNLQSLLENLQQTLQVLKQQQNSYVQQQTLPGSHNNLQRLSPSLSSPLHYIVGPLHNG